MPPHAPSHKDQLEKDISEGVKAAMQAGASDVAAAMKKVTADMLANNPFVPPKGCPINDLPNELLGHIFYLGTLLDDEEEEGEDEEEEDYELDRISGWTSKGKFETGDPSNELEGGEEMDVDMQDDTEGKKTPVSDSSYSSEDEADRLPFQVLVSHVCRHFREVAIESPSLWTYITFGEAPPFDRQKVWIQRSKGLPLEIHIDCTLTQFPHGDGDDHSDASSLSEAPILLNSEGIPHITLPHTDSNDHESQSEIEDFEEEPLLLSVEHLTEILGIVIPHVDRWRKLELGVTRYEYMHKALSLMAECPAAPMLEELELFHYDDCEEYEKFQPDDLKAPFVLFNGIAPKLTHVSLWGVHLSWDESPFLSGLVKFELSYHAKNVRPSWETFAKILQDSPELRTLSLLLSGPGGEPSDWPTDQVIEVPSLSTLVICYHEPEYIESLMKQLYLPNVKDLTLDYDEGDYTEFAHQLASSQPVPLGGSRTKPLLAGLTHLKISGLPCNAKSVDAMLEQLNHLQVLNLNVVSEQEEVFFDKLAAPISLSTVDCVMAGKLSWYCPNLKTILTTGIHGARMKEFVEARRIAGVPLAKVSMSEEDHVDEKDEKWLRNHLESLEFFEPSDSEEEVSDDDLIEFEDLSD